MIRMVESAEKVEQSRYNIMVCILCVLEIYQIKYTSILEEQHVETGEMVQ